MPNVIFRAEIHVTLRTATSLMRSRTAAGGRGCVSSRARLPFYVPYIRNENEQMLPWRPQKKTAFLFPRRVCVWVCQWPIVISESAPRIHRPRDAAGAPRRGKKQCLRKLDEISENSRGYIEAAARPRERIQLQPVPFTGAPFQTSESFPSGHIKSRNLFLMITVSFLDSVFLSRNP